MASKPDAPSRSPSSSTKRQHVVRPFFRKVKTEIHDLFHHHDQDSRHKHRRSSASSGSIKIPADDAPSPKPAPFIPTEPVPESKPRNVPEEKAVAGYHVYDDSSSRPEMGYFDQLEAPSGIGPSQPIPSATSEHDDAREASSFKPKSPPAGSATAHEAVTAHEDALVVVPEIPETSETTTPYEPEIKEENIPGYIPPSSDFAPNADASSKADPSADKSGDESTRDLVQEEESAPVLEIAGRGMADGSSPLAPSLDFTPQTDWEPSPELVKDESTDELAAHEAQTVPSHKLDTAATEPFDQAAIKVEDGDIRSFKDETLPKVPAASGSTSENYAYGDGAVGEVSVPLIKEEEDAKVTDHTLPLLPEIPAKEHSPEVKQELLEPDFPHAPSILGPNGIADEQPQMKDVHATITNGELIDPAKPVDPKPAGIYWDIYSASAAAEGGGEEFGSRSHFSGGAGDEEEEFGSRSRTSRIFPPSGPAQGDRLEDWLDTSSGVPHSNGRAPKESSLRKDPLDSQVRYSAPNGRSQNGHSAQAAGLLGKGLGEGLVDLAQMAILFPFIATLCVFYYLQDLKGSLLSWASWARRKCYGQDR